MLYTSLEKLKSYLTGIDGIPDSIFQDLIKRVSKQFESYLGRSLDKKIYTKYFEGLEDEKLIIVDFGPIKNISKLKRNDQNGDDIQFKRIDENIIHLSEKYTGDIFVEYEGGYEVYFEGLDELNNPITILDLSEIADIEQACLEVCNDLWNNTPSSGNEANIKSKQIETLSKTYFSKNEMAGGDNINYKETLDRYIPFIPY